MLNSFNLISSFIFCWFLFSETNSIEAIALYDYNGRSEKEITFKKGDRLSIKWQLSADWWLGALTAPSTSNVAHDSKYGYIPDKYIALKMRTRYASCTKYFIRIYINFAFNQLQERFKYVIRK